MGRREVSTSVVKWSKGISNSVSAIISRCIDRMKFAVYMEVQKHEDTVQTAENDSTLTPPTT
jgi:hypothetical protein